jgi:hypothetical protein
LIKKLSREEKLRARIGFFRLDLFSQYRMVFADQLQSAEEDSRLICDVIQRKIVSGTEEDCMEDRFENFVSDFIHDQFRGVENGGKDIPQWVRDALDAAGISLERKK